MPYLKLIRPINLIIIFIAQLIIKISLSELRTASSVISYEDFTFLSLATLLIAAGGYVVNDIYDRKADAINKPNELYIGNKVSIKNGWIFYITLTIVGILCASWFCISVHRSEYALLFIALVLLLYLYSSFFQRVAIIGNLITSLLIGTSLYIVWRFELLALVDSGIEAVFAKEDQSLMFFIILVSVVLNFLREVIKDIQDMNGDYATGSATLPIVYGVQRTLILCTVICLALIFNTALFSFIYYKTLYIGLVVMLLGVVIPSSYIASKCWNAKNPSDYKTISRLLKMIMCIGILMIPLLLTIQRYA